MTNRKRVELLAPAGNYECFLAAIHAGADAVYLAGSRFGARAYADNFTTEQLIEAIQYAHLFGRKVYMTVNTLLKQEETDALVAYMIPYYEAGLDGVIIQDMGVFSVLKKHFPGMELHCSTQMTLTGPEGAAFAQAIGANRIVPAREISLDEVRAIHEAYPEMELECFIHGALCYCYSGQCLFSSIVGGRSGNRGTCAQPCRLPYDVAVQNARLKEKYPLSLKDLCTIHMVPELIEAGIASFKIEGRMKSAEYVAGVTGIYRAAIDRYYENPNGYTGPTAEELAVLAELYVRSETEEGYYHHYNGKHMITPDKPSYIGCSDETLSYVRNRYVQQTPTIPVSLFVTLKKNKPATLTVTGNDGSSVTVQGDTVSEALKKPLSLEDAHKQLKKTGGTVFEAKRIETDMEENVFMPVSRLNELRRLALEEMQTLMLDGTGRTYHINASQVQETLSKQNGSQVVQDESEGIWYYAAYVRTGEQLNVCLSRESLQRIYVDDALWQEILAQDTGTGAGFDETMLKKQAERLYYAMPRILRKKSRERLKNNLSKLLEEKRIAGVYVATPDAYELARQVLSGYNKDAAAYLVAAPSLAVMNVESLKFWQERCHVVSIPLELNEKELYALQRAQDNRTNAEMMVYGRIPLMFTANCVRKSFDPKGCRAVGGISYLTDRKNNRIPVVHDCLNCCNIIYNSVPMSLHKHLSKLGQMKMIGGLMLAFTTENVQETENIMDFYEKVGALSSIKASGTIKKNEWNEMPEWIFGDYTNGHFTRGVI